MDICDSNILSKVYSMKFIHLGEENIMGIFKILRMTRELTYLIKHDQINIIFKTMF